LSKIAAMTAVANSRLRAVLALAFGGLLALLLYSGASALHTLRLLHEAEEATHARSLERQRILATVVLSVSLDRFAVGPTSEIHRKEAMIISHWLPPPASPQPFRKIDGG
jgi:hypothetical protein